MTVDDMIEQMVPIPNATPDEIIAAGDASVQDSFDKITDMINKMSGKKGVRNKPDATKRRPTGPLATGDEQVQKKFDKISDMLERMMKSN